MKAPILFLALIAVSGSLFSQSANLYFDGDTSNHIRLILDPADSVWQVGPPDKIIFDSAASNPNVLITDTVNPYPVNDTSTATIAIDPNYFYWGILAIQWKQKLDLEYKADGGVVEFSNDNGLTWINAFDSPYIYNFYGYDAVNRDTLPNGEWAFTGIDNAWKDIWLCMDYSFVHNDTLRVRFVLKSDSSDTQQEGWMIDNLLTHITQIHTVEEIEQEEYLKVYPTVTNDIVHIQGKKLDVFHIIEEIQVVDTQGRVVREHGKAPTKFYLHLGDLPAGMYYLKVKTNLDTQSFPVMVEH